MVLRPMLVRRVGVAADAAGLEAALWCLQAEEAAAGAASTVQWICSYALREADGSFGLACLFHAAQADALRRHADRTRLPAHEIVPVLATRVLRAFSARDAHWVRRQALGRDLASLERRLVAAQRSADESAAGAAVWLHRHAVGEVDGSVGSVCLMRAHNARAVHEHAARAGLPIGQVAPVLGRVVFRPDRLPAEPHTGQPGPIALAPVAMPPGRRAS